MMSEVPVNRFFLFILFSIVFLLPGNIASAQEGEEAILFSAEAEQIDAARARAEDEFAADASGGAYVFLAQASKDVSKFEEQCSYAHFTFDCPEPGNYEVTARVLALSNGTDSFFLICGDRSTARNVPVNVGWVDVTTPIGFDSAGPRKVILAAREPLRLDKVEIRKAEEKSPAVFLRQSEITTPEPNELTLIDLNPPTFRWGYESDAEWEIQYAPVEAAWDAGITLGGIRDSFYRPPQALEPGEWKWQVRNTGKGLAVHSPTSRFTVPEDAVKWPVPTCKEIYASFSNEHPRCYFRAADLPALRRKLDGPMKDYVTSWTAALEEWTSTEIPLEEDRPVEQVSDRRERTIRRHQSKLAASESTSRLDSLAFLGLLLEREDFKEEAIRRSLKLAELDPRGFTSPGVSDFANGMILRGLGSVYDILYHELTPAEREKIRAALVARLQIYRPQLEMNLFNAHAWQFIMLDATVAALAVYDEEPEVEEWLRWATRMFIAFYPWWGGADGGSAEGGAYSIGCNVVPSMCVLQFWNNAAGIDFAQNPWFPGSSWYLLYNYPPGRPTSRFGDHAPVGVPPGDKPATIAVLHAKLLGNPFSLSYAHAVVGEATDFNQYFPDKHYRLHIPFFILGPYSDLPRKPLHELPPARLFRDIGVTFLHTDYANIENNVTLEFRSSPYGSFNHAHADQNSFNVIAYGEEIILDSGHYVGYGDEHHYGWTIHTKAHNAMLFDGKGQRPRHLNAWGKIVHFSQTENSFLVEGEAANAYLDVPFESYRRKVVWNRGNGAEQTFTVVDRVKFSDSEEHACTLLFHFPVEPEIRDNGRRVVAKGKKAQAELTFAYAAKPELVLTDEFDPPVENWRPDRTEEVFPKQWHLALNFPKGAREQSYKTTVNVSPATAEREEIAPSAEETLDLSAYDLKLVYANDFSEPLSIAYENGLLEDGKRVREPQDVDWVFEGPGEAWIEDGKLHVTNSPRDDETAEGGHVVVWNMRTFPENFLLEFEMSPVHSDEGLAIVFFCATGEGAGGIFELSQPPRQGIFKNYIHGKIDCYHVSYWSGVRQYANLRKDRGFHLVADGKDNISGHGPGPHSVRILKVGGDIAVETAGRMALKWSDDGKEYGPVYGAGRIGLRTMAHSESVTYDQFRVWEVSKKESTRKN